LLRYDDTTTLPLLLHLNSEPWMNLDAYAAQSAEVPFPIGTSADDCIGLKLPARSSADGGSPLARIIGQRRSCRDFDDRPLSLALLSRLLDLCYGTRGVATFPDGNRVLQRPLPSAGALYPLELFVCLARVEGTPDGVYRYEPLHHRLEPKGALPTAEELSSMLLAQAYVARANLLVFLVGTLDRTMAKYGMRGYRYLLLEAGHAAQNLCLLATEAGLGTLCIGGFRDALLNRWLGLDTRRSIALYAVAVGGLPAITRADQGAADVNV
jgi:SagB-type dehydrogenase family enzyme